MPRLDALFDEIVSRGGSHLHVAAGGPVLGRIRGVLAPLEGGALDAAAAEEGLLELLSSSQRSRLVEARYLEFVHTHEDAARFRASYFQEARGLGAVFRVVPPRAPSLAELGCPEALRRLAERRGGLVLVVGPASSGKSTTLAAMLDHINETRACHVVTIEDPIEAIHVPLRAQITQREIGAHVPSLEAALRNAPREIPDVVFAGELRTAEASRLAMRLAGSGAAVFATIQARGVLCAIDGLVGSFPADEQRQARSLLAEALGGAVGQLLVSSPDPKGRAAIYEVLVASPAATTAIREGKTAQLIGLMQAGHAQGMLTLDMALERLVEAGRLAPESAMDLAHDKEAFSRIVSKSRPDLADRMSS